MLVSPQLGLCPEASTHLEQMKNALIAISNELLDDDTDLSPERIQELRQERSISKSIFFSIFLGVKCAPFWYTIMHIAQTVGNNTAKRDKG